MDAAPVARLHHLIIDCPEPMVEARVRSAGRSRHPFCLIPRPSWAPPVSVAAAPAPAVPAAVPS